MQKVLLCLLLILSAPSCHAQVCMPTMAGPQPESGYSYIRTEILALQWIRAATTGSEKLQWIAPDDPQRVHKSIEFYTTANSVSDDYDCAVFLLTPYKDSKNEPIHASVDTLLLAIQATKEINDNLITMMETLNKAKKAEDIDQQELAKTLANIKGKEESYIDLCADILLTVLTSKLPSAT